MDALGTARLSLEPVAPDDVPALHGHWTEPGVRRFLWDGRVIAPEEAANIVRTSRRLFREEGVGLWAMRTQRSRDLIGCAGFWYFHEPPELELLISVSEAEWGRGLAREAAAALLEHALTRLGWPAVQASADAPNVASLALMRRLGMRPAGERPGEFGRIEVFRITSEEWRRSAGRAAVP